MDANAEYKPRMSLNSSLTAATVMTAQMLSRIAEQLEYALDARAVSGFALSVQLGISAGTLSNLRRQRSSVSLQLLLQLVEELDVPLSVLLGQRDTAHGAQTSSRLVYTHAIRQLRDNLVLFMTLNHLPTQAFSLHSQLSVGSVHKLLHQQTNPSLLTLVKLSLALDCTVEGLLRDDLPQFSL